MDSNPLLAALQENFGDGTPPPPDPTTVRGLLSFCKMWLDGELQTESLHNPCMEMSGRLKAGAEATEADLKQNPDLVASARDPVKRIAIAYWNIAEVLDHLPLYAADDDVEAFQEAIEDFEHERQVVLDCDAEITRTYSGDTKLCPRCGSSGEEAICSRCEVHRLYPDPKAGEYDRSKTAHLSPTYRQINLAYDAVMSGKSSLLTIFHTLNELEKQLLAMHAGYKKVAATDLSSEDDEQGYAETQELASRVLKEIEKSLSGIQRIKDVQQTYQMSDISRGWDTIFDAAVEIKRATLRYAKAQGLADTLEEDTDSISLGGS